MHRSSLAQQNDLPRGGRARPQPRWSVASGRWWLLSKLKQQLLQEKLEYFQKKGKTVVPLELSDLKFPHVSLSVPDEKSGNDAAPSDLWFWKRNERLVYLANFFHVILLVVCCGQVFDQFLSQLCSEEIWFCHPIGHGSTNTRSIQMFVAWMQHSVSVTKHFGQVRWIQFTKCDLQTWDSLAPVITNYLFCSLYWREEFYKSDIWNNLTTGCCSRPWVTWICMHPF